MRPAAGFVLLSLFTDPLTVMAQSRLQLEGGLAAGHVYDDNLFSTPAAPEPDDIWRVSPLLAVTRRSPRLTLGARYGFDAETYRSHPELDRALSAQDASLSVDWSPSPRLALQTSATYATAQSPGVLNTVTGLEVGRLPGRRAQAEQALTWRLGSRTKGTLEGRFTREDAAGRFRTDTEGIGVAFERKWGPVDEARLRYRGQRFVSGGEVAFAHVVALGWTREVAPSVVLECEAGPRLSGRAVEPEIAAGLSYRQPHGEAAMAYVQTQTTVVGQPGPVTATGVTFTFARVLRSLRLAAVPSFFRVGRRGSEADVDRLALDVSQRLTRGLALEASYELSVQRGGIGLQPDQEIVHNTLRIRAVAATPARR